MSSRRRSREPLEAGCIPEMAVVVLCTACWRELPGGARVCPDCGASAAFLTARSCEEKLWAAVKHPIGEVRQRAATLLGRVCGPEAREPLLALAESASDPYLAVAALMGLQALARRHTLEPIDWLHFTRPGHPMQVRFAAVQILRAGAGMPLEVPPGEAGR